jgi:hypothetical protein
MLPLLLQVRQARQTGQNGREEAFVTKGDARRALASFFPSSPVDAINGPGKSSKHDNPSGDLLGPCNNPWWESGTLPFTWLYPRYPPAL